jgi:AraC-like DNA-binding protein
VSAALRDALLRIAEDPQLDPAVAGVRVHVAHAPWPPVPVLFEPMLYLVVQGGKRLLAGEREVAYGPDTLVTLAADLPAMVEVTEASTQRPYLSLEVPVELDVLTALIAELPPRPRLDVPALGVHPLPEGVLEPALRLARLVEVPGDAAVLAPAARREILYRVLGTPGGDALRCLAVTDSALASVRHVMGWMQRHLDGPVPVEHLAAMASMSPSAFHRHFRQATGTSPTSYHKVVRLHAARRRLAARAGTVSAIAAEVGYVSASQFSREYKRAFGTTPSADAAAFRVG